MTTPTYSCYFCGTTSEDPDDFIVETIGWEVVQFCLADDCARQAWRKWDEHKETRDDAQGTRT